MPVVRRKVSGTSRRQTDRGTATATHEEMVVIKGRRLRTTKVFDTFWKYTAERQAIFERRRDGQPPPWSDDPTLQSAHFCNVFRVTDRGSQFLIREVIEVGSQEPVEVIFRVLVYNIFSRPETYLYLKDHFGGSITWEAYDHDAYVEALHLAYSSNMTLYTGAFQKPAPSLGHKIAYLNHLELLDVMMEKDLPAKFKKWKTQGDSGMRAAYVFFRSLPGMGDFLAYQLLLDLSYTSLLDFVSSNFVTPGHGAVSGMKKCFSPASDLAGIEVDVILWMATTQEEHFSKRGLAFNGLDGHLMRVWDIEHTLCEVDKYARKAHPSVKGDLGRTALKSRSWAPQTQSQTQTQTQTPTRDSNSPVSERSLVFPRSWASFLAQSRAEIRTALAKTRANSASIRVDKVEKQYVISGIRKERVVDGEKQYFVAWQGYSLADCTWEPEASLLVDAPKVVRAYLEEKGADVKMEEDEGGRKKGRRSQRKSIGRSRRESARINIKDEIKEEEEETKPLISPSTPDTDPDLEELSKPIIIDFTPVPSVALSSALTLLSSSSTH